MYRSTRLVAKFACGTLYTTKSTLYTVVLAYSRDEQCKTVVRGVRPSKMLDYTATNVGINPQAEGFGVGSRRGLPALKSKGALVGGKGACVWWITVAL